MKIQEVILRLLIRQPFYGYVAALAAPEEAEWVKTIRMAAVPSLKILYNPDWFMNLRAEIQTGVVLHELLHLILLHPYRRGERDLALWSIACDLAVNEHIDPLLLPEDSPTVELISRKLKLRLPRQKGAEHYYDLLAEKEEDFFFVGLEGDVIIPLDNERQLKVSKLAEEPVSDVQLKSLKSDLAQTLEEARAEGEMPAGLQSLVDEVYHDFKVNWRNTLKRFLSGRGKMEVRKSYKRQSRRFEDLPGTKRSVGIKALVAIDESGSISDGLRQKFYRELVNINKITGAVIQVTRFDTRCTTPVPLKEYIKSSERQKSGGTDFRPVFQLADREKIPLLIIFTDGDGPAPEAANQRTLWVITVEGQKPAPFGHYVVMDE